MRTTESLGVGLGVESQRELLLAIAPLQARLAAHPIYASVCSMEGLRIFMQSHVFAVWDFMSLLKSLQRSLTSVEVPWLPQGGGTAARLVNEIVLGEESDEYEGASLSHFELYLRAMQECGAGTAAVEQMLASLRAGEPLPVALVSIHQEAARFVDSTFASIATGAPHRIAAAFTFGREDVIPSMFTEFIRSLDAELPGRVSTFRYYLERHVELDGDHHGPMALRMMDQLCPTPQHWSEAADEAQKALTARIALWDGIQRRIEAQ